MLNKKIASFATAALAAISIGTTALAAPVAFSFYLWYDGMELNTNPVKKTDDLYAAVTVDEGLAGGDYYATFTVYNFVNNRQATETKDLWVNGTHHLNYLSGMGINGERYYLNATLEPQANADRLQIAGQWEP